MTDHDQQKLIEVDANLPAKAVFKVSIPGIIILLFVETPRKFITGKLSIRKPSANNMILLALMKIRAYGSKALQY